MFRTIKTLLLLIAICFVAASCEKEYSAEFGNTNTGGTQSGTAVFTLDGAPGACSLPTISGTYKAGTPLTTSEKITLVVTVTTPGTYTIATAAINGVTFAGSGSFATAGQTFIELTATGNTPTAAGTFNYVPGTAGCSFPITFTTSTGSSSGTAVYTFAGAPDNCTAPVIAGTYTAGVALTASNTVTLSVNVTTPGTYTVSTGTANGIKFSGSGTFAAAGANTITLVGSGTPVDASVIQYTPGGNGCSFDITVVAGSSGGTQYLRGTIGGTLMEFNTGLSGIYSEPASPIPGIVTFGGNLSSASGAADLSLSFTKTTGVTTGSYSNHATDPFNGFDIVYTDNANVEWTGSVTEDNTITGVLNVVSSTGASGTFTGKLLKNGTGPESITVTGGAFNVSF